MTQNWYFVMTLYKKQALVISAFFFLSHNNGIKEGHNTGMREKKEKEEANPFPLISFIFQSGEKWEKWKMVEE